MPNSGTQKNDFLRSLTFRLLCISIVLLLLYFGKSVLLPIAFGAIFATALASPMRFLESKGISRGLAAFICVILGVLLLGSIIGFIISQIINFKNDFPQLVLRYNELLINLQLFLQNNLKLSERVISQNVDPMIEKLMNDAPTMVGTTISFLSTSLIYAIFTIIYTLLILIYKSNINVFVDISFRHVEGNAVEQIVGKTQGVVKEYISGLMLEMFCVAAMLFVGFMIVGVKYAILLAVISAIFNIVPYLGFISAAILSMVITFATNSPEAALWVGAISMVVHFIDANIILPTIVGSKISINAMATITGVFIGSVLWGIPGMFLAVPAVAILKVVFDEIPSLMHWGVLLGGNLSSRSRRKDLLVRK